nr:LysR family transcriptional regulator [uncultured Holophaga sp.]
MLSSRDLHHFLAVAEAGNISGAAQRLNMAQPPLSRQMKQLEEQLGTTLFERGHRRIQLTETGRLLQLRAGQLMELLATTEKEILDVDRGTRGTLAIGIASSSVAPLLPRVASVFCARYPGLRFELRTGESIEVIELLDQGLVEIGLVRFAIDDERHQSIRLAPEPLVAAFHREGFRQLLGRGEPLPLAALAGLPLLIHRKFESMIAEHCHQAGFEPSLLCTSDDVMPALGWAEAGIGVAVVPRAAIGLLPSANLETRLLVDPLIESGAAIIWMRQRYLSQAARHFIELFADISGEKQGPPMNATACR